LFVSENTIKFHLKERVFQAGVANRLQAINAARQLGFIKKWTRGSTPPQNYRSCSARPRANALSSAPIEEFEPPYRQAESGASRSDFHSLPNCALGHAPSTRDRAPGRMTPARASARDHRRARDQRE